MPSFDAVSELDLHEVTNATDQAKRELGNRWDFKNVTADVCLEKDRVVLSAEHDFQVEQLVDILRSSFTKRGIDARSLGDFSDSRTGKLIKRSFEVRQGIDIDNARKIVKLVKEAKLKVQIAIQGDKVRVTGKKRDDLQEVIQFLRNAELDIPIQFDNFRD
tara:strand:+ start:17416 stop:17898 length:483 start_codon:yes stop_codon:yes gene_type:complete